LFAKCTIAVSATAIGSGTNTAKTGIRIVPNPKPEKKVNSDAEKAVTHKRINITALMK
jgi:hypothetical protein